ncbi:MAG: ACP S-malonyltransferase [Chloroflexi bacterium]|nr:ACP S-malonyltransferase [Chloroflexota bacterium]
MVEDIKVAYVFPGQESIQIGMGLDLFVHYNSAREVFEEVDRTLGFPLSRLCFEGPEEDLAQTPNAQAAVLMVDIACLRAAEEATDRTLPPPALVAGHGAGEYAALVAASVMKLDDAVRLVRERGRLMNEAGRRKPGGMLTILDVDKDIVEGICVTTGVEISNVNAPDNIVISGDETRLLKAKRLAQVKGAKRMVPVKVSGGFYSSLMEPALEGMINAVSQFKYETPSVQIVSNVTAQPMTSLEAIKEELISQIAHGIKWQQSIETMLARGITTFFEVGPGNTLTKYIKSISPGALTFNISNAETTNEIVKWRRGGI